MQTLRETIDNIARKVVENKTYTGFVKTDSEIVAELVFAAVTEHLAQYNPRTPQGKETQNGARN